MTGEVLYVIARMRAKPETAETLRQLWLALRDETRKEPGCISYQVLQNSRDGTEFTSIEQWADAAAEAAHMTTPHVQTFVSQLAPLLAERGNMQRYRDAD
jgi:quinol monooxygenase YgiN